VQVDYTGIRAPITGRAGFALVTLGNVVHANDTTGIVTITQTDRSRRSLPLLKISSGNPRSLQCRPRRVAAQDAGGGATLATGTLAVINNQVDQATGTDPAQGHVREQGQQALAGQSVSTQLLLRTLQNVVVIPDEALQRGPSGFFVYRHRRRQQGGDEGSQGGAARPRGRGYHQRTRLREKLVVSGQYRLQNGTTVARERPDAAFNGRAKHSQHSRAPEACKPSGLSHGARRNILAVDSHIPIATSLVMVGILFVGLIAYPNLPVAPLPQGTSRRSRCRLVSGCEPGNHGFLDRAAAGAAVLADPRRVGDDVFERARLRPRSRCSSSSTATSTPPPMTCRRHQCRGGPAAVGTCRARRPTARSTRPTRRS
jgi:hypothetical protein